MDHAQDSSIGSPDKPDVVLDVTILDILEYVGESVRPVKQGYSVYAANHIVCIGYRKHNGLVTEVAAFVTQTSHPGLAPHEVKMKIQKDISNWILECSCKAGTAKCKHLIACLFHIEKNPTLEYLSCTDVKQAWGINKSQKTILWSAKRVQDLCCVPTPPELKFRENITDQQIEDQILATAFNRILSVSKQSAIAKHMAGRVLNEPNTYPDRAVQSSSDQQGCAVYVTENDIRNLLTTTAIDLQVVDYLASSPESQSYYEKFVDVDTQKIISIALDTRCQSTNEWKIHRSKRITASSAYKLFTYLKNKNPDWDKKIYHYWDMKSLNVKSTKYGKDTEPLAFECYRKKRNKLVKKCGLVIHPTQCWIAGSPDGIDCNSSVLLEIKCPGDDSLTLEQLMELTSVQKYIKTGSGTYKLNPKHMYFCQVQINMWILNCTTCDFVVYSKKDDNFVLIDVPFDENYTTNVVNSLKKLYFDRMLPNLCSKSV